MLGIRNAALLRVAHFIFALCMLSCTAAHAAEAEAADVRTLRALLEQPEDQIDIARAKLTIDKMINPATDVDATLAVIDAMAATNLAVLRNKTSAQDKMLTLREYLYIAGPWNANNPFRYNFDHPQGLNIEDMQLANYVKTRRGQCISMPLLYIAVAQRIGMHVTLGLMPNHTFVMWKNDEGKWINIEATNFGNPTSLATYQRQAKMSARSLESGAYMRPLTKRETVATMLEILYSKEIRQNHFEHAIEIADLAIHYLPTFISPYLFKANAYHHMIVRDYTSKYSSAQELSLSQKLRFKKLADLASASEDKAFSLGFVIPDKDAKPIAVITHQN